MATKTSKTKVSSYQRLKDKNQELEFLLEMMITRPQAKSTKDLKLVYKLDNNLE